MMEFLVQDISCKHCAAHITNAVVNVDPSALVEVDIDSKLVKIDTKSVAEVMSDAIVQAGYTPVLQPG